MKINKSTARIAWVDVLRGTCMISVVMGHTYCCPPKVQVAVSSFHIAVFFMLSGYVLNTNIGFGLFLKKKAKSVLIPYVVFSIIYVLVRAILYGEGTWRDLFYNIFLVPGECDYALWFLSTLFFSQIIVYFISKLREYGGLKTIAFILFICSVIEYYFISFVGELLPLNIHCWLTATVFVGSGWFIREAADHLKDLFKFDLRIIVVALVTWIMATMMNYSVLGEGCDIATLHMGNYFFYFASIFSMFIALANIFSYIDNFATKLIGIIGKNSLVIYCTHYYVLWILQEYAFPYNKPIIWIYAFVVVATVVAIFVCTIVSELITRKAPILLGKF